MTFTYAITAGARWCAKVPPVLPSRPPCPVCPLRRNPNAVNVNGTFIRMVQPTGPMPADIMLIGDAPDGNANRRGYVFEGRVGREFNDLYLPLSRLHRDDVYVTNAMKCQRVDNEAPEPDEARVCADYWLPDELAMVQPKHVVLMGTTAARAVLPTADSQRVDMDTHHGQLYGKVVYSGNATRWLWNVEQPRLYGMPRRPHIVVTYHPNAGLAGSDMMIPLMADFRALGDVLAMVGAGQYPHPIDPFPFPVYRELTTAAQVWEALAPARSITKGRIVATDTETDGKNGPPWCLSFSTAPGMGYVIPADCPEALAAFALYVNPQRNPWVIVLLHNALFDLGIIKQMGVTGYRWRDTMHTAYQLGNQPQALKPLAFRLCGMEMVDYSEVVRYPSINPMLEWARDVATNTAAAIPIKQPKKKLVLEPHHKEWKKHNGLLQRRVKKLETWQLEQLFPLEAGKKFPDPWEWWDDRTPIVRGMLSMFGNHKPMPAESIVHVPRPRAIDYAGRDGDATLRAWWALRRKVKELSRVVPVGAGVPNW